MQPEIRTQKGSHVDYGFDRVDIRIAEQLVKGPPVSVKDLLEAGARVLGYSEAIDGAHDDEAAAKELLAAALGMDEDDLEESARPAHRRRERYLSYIARRAAGEPVGLILGHVEFCGLRLQVQPGTFMPRPSSVHAVERALFRISRRKAPVVVDLCCGVGSLGLAVANQRSDAEVWGVDISRRALALARGNARRLRIPNATFRLGDAYRALPAPLSGSVDVIVGSIPYVVPDEVPDLPAEISEYEPLFSLTDLSPDGMSLLRRVAREAPAWLKAGGYLLVQLSEDVAPTFAEICAATGFAKVNVVSSPHSWDLMVEARCP